MVFPAALDLLRQAFHLPSDVVLLVDMRGAELVEFADFGIDLDLFHDGGIARGDGLDLGIGECAAFEVFRLADGDAAIHDLIDEARFRFEHLPHIGIERSFGDVAVDLDFRIVVALPQNSALALLDVARSPRRVEVMERDEPFLHVRAGAHFLGGAQKDADAPGIHRIKQVLLLPVGLGVMDIGDFFCRDAFGNEFVADFVIDVEAVGIGRREVAEHKLGQPLVFAFFPRAMDVMSGANDFGIARLTMPALSLLRSAIAGRKNILISGGTSTGKTTLLNALASLIDPADRLVVIEDTAELYLTRSQCCPS